MDPNPHPGDSTPDAATPADRFRNTLGKDAELDREETLWEGRYSGKAMYGSWLLALIGSIAAAAAAFFLLPGTPLSAMIVGGVLLVVWGWLAITLLMRKLNIHYHLTTQRLIHKRGLVRRVTDRIEVIDIDDVTYVQGIVQRMLGVGTVRIRSSDRSHPELSLIGIDNVQQVADLIDDVRRRERRKRAVHIESV